MQKYLESSQYINCSAPEVFDQAKKLASNQKDKEQIAKACFEFVRDQIKHSWDYNLPDMDLIKAMNTFQ